jgi:hypothetical protein
MRRLRTQRAAAPRSHNSHRPPDSQDSHGAREKRNVEEEAEAEREATGAAGNGAIRTDYRRMAIHGVLSQGWSIETARPHLRPGDEEYVRRNEWPPDLAGARA